LNSIVASSVAGEVDTMTSCMSLLLFVVIGGSYVAGFEPSRSMPIQMDVGLNKHITICTGLKRYISCRDGSNIAITYAFWGRTSDKICPSDDGDPVTDCEGADETMGLVQQHCETKDECQLEARHNKLQKNGTHHCPGVNKYLIVNYTCIPESKGALLCDSEKTTLECKAGWKMEITEVFWGRRASTKYCGTDEGMECDSSDYASKFLKQKCSGKQKCEITASTDVLDDKKAPCAGMLKYLMVSYICKPPKFVGKPAEEEESPELESKLLTDSSSKELMGLLEKHLNEIKDGALEKSKPVEAAAPAVAAAPAKNLMKSIGAKAAQKYKQNANTAAPAPVAPAPAQPAARDILARSEKPLFANEDDEVANALLNGALAKEFKKDVTARKKDETPQPPMEEEKAASSIPAHLEVKKDTTPTVAVEEPKKEEALQSAEAKSQIPKTKEDSAKRPTASAIDDVELSEPNTVKSILARAKEVLKTLDSQEQRSEQESSQDLKKRAQIPSAQLVAQKTKDAKDAAQNIQQLAQQLESRSKVAKKPAPAPAAAKAAGKAATTTQDKKIQQASFSSDKIREAAQAQATKPKPGPRKEGLKVAGTGSAGVGNTP